MYSDSTFYLVWGADLSPNVRADWKGLVTRLTFSITLYAI